MVCSILVSQLPENVQPALHLWLDEREIVDGKDARTFLIKVKTALVDLGRIAFMSLDVDRKTPQEKVEPRPTTEETISDAVDTTEVNVSAIYRNPQKQGYRRRGANVDSSHRYSRTNFRGASSRTERCFICGSFNHFMAQCPEKYCQKCGQKGHDARVCSGPKSRRGIFCVSKIRAREMSVMLPVTMNGNKIDVMLDTGADLSVIDLPTLQKLGITYQRKNSKVFGVGHIPLRVCSLANVSVDLGDGQMVEYDLEVLDTEVRTVVLGRRFLALFGDTTFDWERLRVKIGGHWKATGFPRDHER